MRRTLAAISGVLVLATACSAGGGSGKTPSGYSRAQGSAVSVAYPGGWQSATDQGVAAAVQGPGQKAFIEVLENLAKNGSADLLEATVEAGPQMQAKGYKRTSTKKIGVKGAESAERIDYTFTGFNGGALPGQGVDVALLGKDGRIHAVRITYAQGSLDTKTVSGIVDSIQVK